MKIKAEKISGFPEFLPEEEIFFREILDKMKKIYESHGFVPLETTFVEKKDIIKSKGGDDKEIYSLSRLVPDDVGKNETDLALHFDLTLPLSRYVSLYMNKINFPFKRYQIQKVWRGERAQSGRYREFYQADIDILNLNNLSIFNDAEIIKISAELLEEILGKGEFIIKISNRKILFSFLKSLKFDLIKEKEVVKILDSFDKIGKEKVLEKFRELKLTESEIDKIFEFINLNGSDFEKIFLELRKRCNNKDFEEGIRELEEIFEILKLDNDFNKKYEIDFKIIRGLDYYTGMVFETFWKGKEKLGSICSGGRYDNLVENFSDFKIPGVGASIGLSRLVKKILEEKQGGMIKTKSDFLILNLDKEMIEDVFLLADKMRRSNLKVDIFLEDKKISQQMNYADKKKYPFVIFYGQNEKKEGTIKVKNMIEGKELSFLINEFISEIKKILC